MLTLFLLAVVVALGAGALGFTRVSAGAAGVAKIIFGVFVVIALVLLVLVFAGTNVLAG